MLSIDVRHFSTVDTLLSETTMKEDTKDDIKQEEGIDTIESDKSVKLEQDTATIKSEETKMDGENNESVNNNSLKTEELTNNEEVIMGTDMEVEGGEVDRHARQRAL